jgi:hypothetical protein
MEFLIPIAGERRISEEISVSYRFLVRNERYIENSPSYNFINKINGDESN